jgi:hypothetical protein
VGKIGPEGQEDWWGGEGQLSQELVKYYYLFHEAENGNVLDEALVLVYGDDWQARIESDIMLGQPDKMLPLLQVYLEQSVKERLLDFLKLDDDVRQQVDEESQYYDQPLGEEFEELVTVVIA